MTGISFDRFRFRSETALKPVDREERVRVRIWSVADGLHKLVRDSGKKNNKKIHKISSSSKSRIFRVYTYVVTRSKKIVVFFVCTAIHCSLRMANGRSANNNNKIYRITLKNHALYTFIFLFLILSNNKTISQRYIK